MVCRQKNGVNRPYHGGWRMESCSGIQNKRLKSHSQVGIAPKKWPLVAQIKGFIKVLKTPQDRRNLLFFCLFSSLLFSGLLFSALLCSSLFFSSLLCSFSSFFVLQFRFDVLVLLNSFSAVCGCSWACFCTPRGPNNNPRRPKKKRKNPPGLWPRACQIIDNSFIVL